MATQQPFREPITRPIIAVLKTGNIPPGRRPRRLGPNAGFPATVVSRKSYRRAMPREPGGLPIPGAKAPTPKTGFKTEDPRGKAVKTLCSGGARRRCPIFWGVRLQKCEPAIFLLVIAIDFERTSCGFKCQDEHANPLTKWGNAPIIDGQENATQPQDPRRSDEMPRRAGKNYDAHIRACQASPRARSRSVDRE
jgi:hypothetical protein